MKQAGVAFAVVLALLAGCSQPPSADPATPPDSIEGGSAHATQVDASPGSQEQSAGAGLACPGLVFEAALSERSDAPRSFTVAAWVNNTGSADINVAKLIKQQVVKMAIHDPETGEVVPPGQATSAGHPQLNDADMAVVEPGNGLAAEITYGKDWPLESGKTYLMNVGYEVARPNEISDDYCEGEWLMPLEFVAP